ncbi:MAG: hypothetical protein SF029_02625 [bacterium]|nr:hypothetical protein [bacterium]
MRSKLINRQRELRPRSTFSIPPTSLMWPGERPAPNANNNITATAWENDLGLGEIASALSTDRRYAPFMRSTLAALLTDADVIRWRQAVLADFLRNPALVERIEALLPRFVNLREGSALFGTKRRNLLLETSDRLSELELYTDVVRDLSAALQAADLQSPALTTVRDHLAGLLGDTNFQALCDQLPDLRAPLEQINSLTIGVNLDTQLQPTSAVLLGINAHHIGEAASFLDKLIGTRTDDTQEVGLAPLHHTPKDPDERPLSPLFQDLDRLMTQVAQPIARALTRYVKTSSGAVMALENELAFYVAAVRLIWRLEARGVTFCQPEILPLEARQTQIDGLVNLHLALRQPEPPVPNAVRLDDDGRIGLVTGPNSGGKTTYLQSVGLAQALFQAGLFLPAHSARLSPVDLILTHFPALETRQQGRLAEEATRLRTLFTLAGRHTLVLLNETFATTASGEAVYLAQDILAGLRALGARALYATHLVELAAHLDEIEAAAPGDSRLFCLVAGVQLLDDGRAVSTYTITRGEPLGRSYAQEIARRHGISLAQILALTDDTPLS